MTVANPAPAAGDARTIDEFRAARAPAWSELAKLVAARTRRRRAPEVMRLALLHRQAVADLALARRRWPGESVVDALEALVASSHTALAAPGQADYRRLLAWLRRGCWQAMRSSLPWAGASAAVLLGSALVGAAWAGTDAVEGGRLVAVSLRRDIAAGEYRAPVGPLAAALGFAAAACALVGAAVVLAWVGLEVGASAALAWDADGAAATAERLVAAAPLLTAAVLAAAAGARAGWAIVRGERREWPAALAEGAQVLATLVPLALLGAGVRDVGVGRPGAAAVEGVVLAGAWWAAVLALGRPAA